MYTAPTYVVLLAVVAVGSVTPIAVYVAFQDNVCDVPLSKSLNSSLSPTTGVPVGALIVSAAASAVYPYRS